MKKGDMIGRNKDGEILYFIGYSVMKYGGKPLLLCHTEKDAPPALCGNYTEAFFINQKGEING